MTVRLEAIVREDADSTMRSRWISSPFPLSPWQTWTLLCLVRHRGRQQFVADTITCRLGGDLEALATAGAFGHPDRSQAGVVPGDADWEYYFHGQGCCLTHRQSGEAIDIDFYDKTSDWIDPYFFVRYLNLALEYFPDIAVETFRRALRSQIPCNRTTAASALAIVDQPWSRAELIKVLNESHDHAMTSECRSALMTTHSADAHARVLEWEARHPREPEDGPFISMTEMSLRMSDGKINYEMEKLHSRVMPLREIVVPAPAKRWWDLRS